MRIRQMGFSSRLVAHRHLLTLETLKFIVAYLEDPHARRAAERAGIPDTYASRQGNWLLKLPIVKAALERELDERDRRRLRKALDVIQSEISACEEILGIEGFFEERGTSPEL